VFFDPEQPTTFSQRSLVLEGCATPSIRTRPDRHKQVAKSFASQKLCGLCDGKDRRVRKSRTVRYPLQSKSLGTYVLS
jgi:hypothetical protein